MRKTEKELQVRATHKDTQHKQNELYSLLRRKIETNTALTADEKETFANLTADALLSHGWKRCFYYIDNKRIDLGSARLFALNLIDINKSEVYLNDPLSNKRYKLPIKELWKVLYRRCKELSQGALSEAIHMSKEMPRREEPSSLVYSSKEE